MRAAAWVLLGSLLGPLCLGGAYKCRPPVPQGGHKLWVHGGGCTSTTGRTSHGLRAHRGRSFRQKRKDRHTGRQVGRGKYRSREAETEMQEGSPRGWGRRVGERTQTWGALSFYTWAWESCRAAWGRKELKFINQNHNLEILCSESIHANLLKNQWNHFSLDVESPAVVLGQPGIARVSGERLAGCQKGDGASSWDLPFRQTLVHIAPVCPQAHPWPLSVPDSLPEWPRPQNEDKMSSS